MSLTYNREPDHWMTVGSQRVAVFDDKFHTNIHAATVDSFGREWTYFKGFSEDDIKKAGDMYFDIVSDEMVNHNTYVLDVGCGSGRWSKYLAPRVRFIEATDPSESVSAAAECLSFFKNVRVTRASLDNLPFADESFDFIFSLGVLHHVPDTKSALHSILRKLKPSGTILLYLYYRFDDRGVLFKILFKISNVIRLVISTLPSAVKRIVCEIIATLVYLPLARLSRCFDWLGMKRWSKRMPLSYYADKSFYIMRNDALDRFGTPLELRYTRGEIQLLLESAGMTDVRFSDQMPFWHVTARKR